jgi:hypothetical protein
LNRASIFAALLLITGTPGCSSNQQPSAAKADGANDSQPAASEAKASTSTTSASSGATNKKAAPDSVVSATATPEGPALASYDGKEPFTKVDGVAFLDHSIVRAEVEKVVADPAIRKWVLEAGANPWSPMFIRAGQLVAIGCQQHACDKRSWAISIDLKSQAARVCYEREEVSRWYGADGIRPIEGDCPIGKEDFDE